MSSPAEQEFDRDDVTDGWFPESVASDYDAPGGANDPAVVQPMVDLLAELAGDGAVLELAVGTGRIAAPLAARGLDVKGIELSRAMAARIADKPGGERVAVTIGDMTTARVPGEFSLVVLVFNTISNVTTQDGQVAVFRNAAAHLRPGGCSSSRSASRASGSCRPDRTPFPSRWLPIRPAAATWASTSTTW